MLEESSIVLSYSVEPSPPLNVNKASLKCLGSGANSLEIDNVSLQRGYNRKSGNYEKPNLSIFMLLRSELKCGE